jgi:hypothetical protein
MRSSPKGGGYVRFLAEDAHLVGPVRSCAVHRRFGASSSPDTRLRSVRQYASTVVTTATTRCRPGDRSARKHGPCRLRLSIRAGPGDGRQWHRASKHVDEPGMVVATARGRSATPTGTRCRADHDLRIRSNALPGDGRAQRGSQPGARAARRRKHRRQEAYSYSDGSGHEAMKKIPAEPGLAPGRDDNGAPRAR